jgi:hypothetical protein
MEKPDFLPTQPSSIVYLDRTKEEFLGELAERKKTVERLEFQSKDPKESEEDRKKWHTAWIREKTDLLDMEEALHQNEYRFKSDYENN